MVYTTHSNTGDYWSAMCLDQEQTKCACPVGSTSSANVCQKSSVGALTVACSNPNTISYFPVNDLRSPSQSVLHEQNVVPFGLRNQEGQSGLFLGCCCRFNFSNVSSLHVCSAVAGDTRRLIETYENIWVIFENIAHPCKGDTLPSVCQLL